MLIPVAWWWRRLYHCMHCKCIVCLYAILCQCLPLLCLYVFVFPQNLKQQQDSGTEKWILRRIVDIGKIVSICFLFLKVFCMSKSLYTISVSSHVPTSLCLGYTDYSWGGGGGGGKHGVWVCCLSIAEYDSHTIIGERSRSGLKKLFLSSPHNKHVQLCLAMKNHWCTLTPADLAVLVKAAKLHLVLRHLPMH